MATPSATTMTFEQWTAEGQRRFGADRNRWRFVCPCCGHVATPADWRAAGASDGEIAFSCVGRHVDGARKAFEERGVGPCSYAGGGLFKLNPVTITAPDGTEHSMFAFAAASAADGATP
jgi:hypothetical protein